MTPTIPTTPRFSGKITLNYQNFDEVMFEDFPEDFLDLKSVPMEMIFLISTLRLNLLS